MCHGVDGMGMTPAGKALKAASFKTPALVNSSDSDLIIAVKNGKNKMSAYAGQLSDAQIQSIMSYICTIQM